MAQTVSIPRPLLKELYEHFDRIEEILALTATKLRPALVLYEGEKDVVVSFISSRTNRAKPVDIIIGENNA
jgi:hypothetical protein